MKMHSIMLGFFFSSIIHARLIEVPDWIDQVDCILEGVKGIEAMLLDDVRLYQHWNKALEGMFKDFEHREADRTKLFGIVREKISLLQSNIALCEADKASKLEEQEVIIQELQDTIAVIRNEAHEEIGRLTNLIGVLNEQIKEAREAYATLVNLDSQKAEALIAELVAIKHAYHDMIEERTMFIATLDRFVKRTCLFLSKESKEINQLGVELVGPSYYETPATDEPASCPDSGTSEEDEINNPESNA